MAVLTPASFSLIKPDPWMRPVFNVNIISALKIVVSSMGDGTAPSYSKILELLGNIQKDTSADFPDYVPFFIDMVEPGKTMPANFLLIYKKEIVNAQIVLYNLISTYSFQKGDYVTSIRYASDNSYKLIFFYDGKEALVYELLGIHSPVNEQAFKAKKTIKIRNKAKREIEEVMPKPRKRLVGKAKLQTPQIEVPSEVEKVIVQEPILTAYAESADVVSDDACNSITVMLDLLNLSSLKLLQSEIESRIALKDIHNAPGDVNEVQVKTSLPEVKKRSLIASYVKRVFKR